MHNAKADIVYLLSQRLINNNIINESHKYNETDMRKLCFLIKKEKHFNAYMCIYAQYKHCNLSYILSKFKEHFRITEKEYEVSVEHNISKLNYLFLIKNYNKLHTYLEYIFLEPISTNTFTKMVTMISSGQTGFDKIINYHKTHLNRSLFCALV